jgi:hypothetical protein
MITTITKNSFDVVIVVNVVIVVPDRGSVFYPAARP